MGFASVIAALGFFATSNSALWPIHNILNAAIAVNVSRALQIPKLSWIIALLLLLVGYDFIFVNGTQMLTDGGISIMESVAKAKLGIDGSTAMTLPSQAMPIMDSTSKNVITLLWDQLAGIFTSATWRPGLFEVSMDGKVTDGLGLGDVVFPGILTGWSYRYDLKSIDGNEGQQGSSIFQASIAGYALGCFLCEIFQTGQGQPALIYIVPSMLLAVITTGLRKGKLLDMLNR